MSNQIVRILRSFLSHARRNSLYPILKKMIILSSHIRRKCPSYITNTEIISNRVLQIAKTQSRLFSRFRSNRLVGVTQRDSGKEMHRESPKDDYMES